MSKADLKAAMDALDVKKPYRLAIKAPAFVPPLEISIESTLVGNPTQVQNSTGVENATQVAIPAGAGNQAQVDKTTPVENHTQVEKPTPVGFHTPVADSTPASVGKPTPAGVGNPTYFKDTERYLNKNSLSELPGSLQKYFEELKPQKKREGEWQEFKNLQQDYSAEQVADCVVYLASRGAAVEGEPFRPCHSPMAYLAKAIPQVLGEATQLKNKTSARLDRERHEAQAEKMRRIESANEEREAKDREVAFSAAFPSQDEQAQAIQEYMPPLPGIRPDGPIARNLAIAAWWMRRNQDQSP